MMKWKEELIFELQTNLQLFILAVKQKIQESWNNGKEELGDGETKLEFFFWMMW